MAKWEGIRSQQLIPGNVFSYDFGEVLGPVTTFLQSVADFLGLVKSFLFDFGNPLSAVIDTLLQEIVDLLTGMRQTGIFFLSLLPNFSTDPELLQIKGGYDAFVRRITASLGDSEDSNRPQFGPTNLMGGVIFALDTDNIGELTQISTKINGFLNRAKAAQPAAPINVTARPADTEGEPIATGPTLGTFEVGGALLEWQTPGLLTTFSLPSFFLVERSSRKQGLLQETQVPLDTFANIEVPGDQSETVPIRKFGVQHSEWEVVAKVTPASAAFTTEQIPTQDEFGLLHFPDDTENDLSTLLLSVRSEDTFSFFDPTAKQGETYYYRVRSLYEEVSNEKIVDLKVVGGDILSEPSSPTSVAIPFTLAKLPTDPDTGKDTSIHKAMLVLYRAAYALQFYRLETEFPGASPLGTESVPEIDARNLFGWLNVITGKGVPADKVGVKSAQDISNFISAFSNRAANQLIKRPQAADLFTSVYVTKDTQLRLLWDAFSETLVATNVADLIQTPPDIGTDTDRAYTLKMINLVRNLGKFTGAPPNWEGVRLLEDLFPYVEKYLAQAVTWLQGLIKGGQGIVTDVKDYIEFLESKVDFLLQFIESLETTLQFLVTTDFGAYILNIPPETGGVNYFTDVLLNAEKASGAPINETIFDEDGIKLPPGALSASPGPSGGANDYTAGLVLAYGSQSGADATFEATRAAFEAFFGAVT